MQRFSRGLTDSAMRVIAASVVDTRSQSLGFDLSTDRVSAALAAARPQTQALHKLISEPMGPALSSLLRRDLVPSLDVPAGVTIGPKTTLASLLPNVDLDAAVDSACEVVTEPADALEKEALRVARRNLLWTKINAISSSFGSATATLTLLLLLSGNERVQRLAQQMVDHLYELSRSLSS